jgi:[acyl-carrier-protein] S-malonyltransferase
VIGLDAAEVERLCAEADGLVVPANVNSPTQIVVSGDEDAVERVVQAAEAAGARRAVRLQVAAAFHTERMAPVQERMAEAAGAVDWQDPSFPLASNARGGLVDDALSLRAALVQQITSSVRWVECVEALASAGAERYVELGPGRVLSGLVRQIIRGAETSSAGSPAELEALGSASDAGRP